LKSKIWSFLCSKWSRGGPWTRNWFIDFILLCFCRDTRESLERTLCQLAEVQGALERQRQEAEADTRRDREQEVKLMIDSVAAAELDNLR
jgi:hypothetical protein